MSFALLAVLVAAAPVKIASPAWNVVDIKPELASFYEEQLAQALRAEGFQVTTAADIATLLGAERQKELLGCASTATNCMAELGNALGCEATLTVNLARLGGGFRGLAKLMSSKDGSVLSSVKIDATTEAQLADRLETAAKELARPLRTAAAPQATVKAEAAPEPEPVKVEKPGVTRVAPKFWWLPGAVGLVPAVVGGVLIGVAGGRYESLTTTGSSLAGANFASEGRLFQTVGWVCVTLGAAAVTSSVLWLLLGSTEVQPQLAITPAGASLGLGGRF
jgi:hypothetical protein